MTLPDCRQTLDVDDEHYRIFNIAILEEAGCADISRLPFSIRILLENLLRHMDGGMVTREDVMAVANWGRGEGTVMIPFHPARVLMQDFTGVPGVVDLAAMRDAVVRAGGDPEKINPLVPVDLVVDHSVQVDYHGRPDALGLNKEKEYQRNLERYKLLKWAQQSFHNFRVVPPGAGICHQVNLEHLAEVVRRDQSDELADELADGLVSAYPDTLVGTDSHTTMINGLGVLGWGVGGIEAEAVMLGQPYFMTLPQVVGVSLSGVPAAGVTATDLVLHITQVLRRENVVEKFVEFTGPGMKALSLTDRATIANMAPEYGATMGFFPVDEKSVAYLAMTGRKRSAALTNAYAEACMMFSTGLEKIEFTRRVQVNLADVEPSVAGPLRPMDRVPLARVKRSFLDEVLEKDERGGMDSDARKEPELDHGSIVIASITSCTNTSNPSVMLGAGLAARNAVAKGLRVPDHVKTSLAPGSAVVVDYLNHSGLMPSLEALGFHVVGLGCATCIGNSGPLAPEIEAAIREKSLNVVSVLSGNRNFEARIHQSICSNYLMSPILVVMYALAGRIDLDLYSQPLGYDPGGNPVFMEDIWPHEKEIQALVESHVKPEFFTDRRTSIFKGDENWQGLDLKESLTFEWEPESLYIRHPPFFEGFKPGETDLQPIKGARALMVLGDSVTTDHISPAGAIPRDYPGGRYLMENGVQPGDFNSYGSRRGNHEVMMRGTFGNIRINNSLVDESGSFTTKFPENRPMFVYDAAMAYKTEGTPLVVLGGREYGTGSSRDWAAKGTCLLGVRAVIALSFERIHRSNLVGMGVLPLVLKGTTWEELALAGDELFEIRGISDMEPGGELKVAATDREGGEKVFSVTSRLDTRVELEYYRSGGILQYVLEQIII